MDNDTGQKVAEMVTAAIVTKLVDKIFDQALIYFKSKRKTPRTKRRRKQR